MPDNFLRFAWQATISIFIKKEKKTTYSDLRKSADLLNYLSLNNITSVSEFENKLNCAAEKYQSLSDKHDALSKQINAMKKIITDGESYLALSSADFLTSEEKVMYNKVSYVEASGITDREDLNARKSKLAMIKNELSDTANQLELFKSERDTIAANYETYLKNMSNPSYAPHQDYQLEPQPEENLYRRNNEQEVER